MKAIIDHDGRIALGPELQNRLGVGPGDEVILENRGDELIIKAANNVAGLCREGNVLVHRGVCTRGSDHALDDFRSERLEDLCQGLAP
jgi:bifunctional DNA-binding transcriptional regulator/antitoxin component of YhaV-PrlF toxin-antitoxin module